MYLSSHGLGYQGPSSCPMVCSSMTPSGFRSSPALAEVGVVEARADVLEHADGDDAVELAVDLAVVLQGKAHAALEPLLARARAGDAELLGRQRDAQHVGGAADLLQVERQAAPAGADVEHAAVGLDQQLGGDQPLLGELRLLEASGPDARSRRSCTAGRRRGTARTGAGRDRSGARRCGARARDCWR